MKKKLLFFLALLSTIALSGQVFTDVTQQSGINILPGMGDVAVWIDHNNNGWQDFIYRSIHETKFYQNNGDGTFTDITQQSGLQAIIPHALAVGDFNNDGFPDLLVSSINATEPLKVYQNNAGNGFTLGYTAPISCQRAIWLDYNGNGLLDIFCNQWSGQVNLLKNNGDGSFTDISHVGNFHQNSGKTSAAADYNNNGLQDIYCTSYSNTNSNRLYSNVAAKTYSDATFDAMVMDFRRGVAQAWGDFNNNGWLDLYVGNINSNRNVFFKNNADGTFTEMAIPAGIQDVGDARTCAWIDVNNDGLLDLFTTNHVYPNRLYINNGDETFTNQANAAGIADPQDGFSVSWGDFDRDGDLDVLIAGHSYGMVLLRNDGGNNLNFLSITLVGDYDNKSGIGARITMFHDTTLQIREINGGRGAASQDALTQHFGLGNIVMVDSIHIRWPSGMIQRLYDVDANQFLTINQQGNVPPSIFHLIQPMPDTLCTSGNVTFKWTASFDPDHGNTIDYFLHLEQLHADTIYGPLQDTLFNMNTAHWPETDTITWHVVASDGSDTRRSWEKWTFTYCKTTGLKPVSKVPENRFTVLSLSPMPAVNLLNVEIETDQPETLNITLHNYSGELIGNFGQFDLKPGRHTITLHLSNNPVGLNYLRLSTRHQTQYKKVVLM